MRKAKGVSVSLGPKEREILDKLVIYLKLKGRSQAIQYLIRLYGEQEEKTA